MLVINRCVFNVIAVIIFLFAFKSMAADDEYLKMLEGESEDSQLDQRGQIQEVGKNNGGSVDDVNKTKTLPHEKSGSFNVTGDVFISGLTEVDFPEYIKNNFYGTYVFFRKLDAVDRRTIYYHYSKNKDSDINTIRKDILNHIRK